MCNVAYCKRNSVGLQAAYPHHFLYHCLIKATACTTLQDGKLKERSAMTRHVFSAANPAQPALSGTPIACHHYPCLRSADMVKVQFTKAAALCTIPAQHELLSQGELS